MLALIAVVASNRMIGRDQQLLWRLPEDMRHFRSTTSGKPVIMGRKTWESLPPACRPLPGRHNIVVSRNPACVADGASLAASLPEAIRLAGDAPEVFVIGGAELYRQALPLAGRLYLTEVAAEAEGDAVFPELLPGEWREISRRSGKVDGSTSTGATSGPAFDFVIFERTQAAGCGPAAPAD